MELYELRQDVRQHHFILRYDSDTKQWELDTELESDLLPDGTIWNETALRWEHGYIGDGEYAHDEDQTMEAIVKAINMLNGETNENN